MIKNFERPMAAFQRPIGPPDQDKALTRNRMGFFICFDLSEEDSASLKEAMNIHNQLKKYLKSRGKQAGCGMPVIMFVGTKMDKTANYKAIETNSQIELAFQKMVDAVSAREVLWQFEGADDGIEE